MQQLGNIMRIFEVTSLFTQLILDVYSKIVPFCIFIAAWAITIALWFFIMGSNYQNAKKYEQTTLPFGYLIMVFENSIGNISNPTLQYWKQSNYDIFDDVCIFIIWMIWLFNQFFCLVILLNFLIAILS